MIDYRRLTINEFQAIPTDPTFKVGKDFIFFCKCIRATSLENILYPIKLSSMKKALNTLGGIQGTTAQKLYREQLSSKNKVSLLQVSS